MSLKSIYLKDIQLGFQVIKNFLSSVNNNLQQKQSHQNLLHIPMVEL